MIPVSWCCVALALLLVLPSASAGAQSAIDGQQNAYEEQKHHFLSVATGTGGGGRGVAGLRAGGSSGIGGSGFQEGSEPYDPMTEEESLVPDKKMAEQVKKLIKLIDGETVILSNGANVRLIGIDVPDLDSNMNQGDYQSFVKQTSQWIRAFVKNPEDAMEAYPGANRQFSHKDGTGRTFVYFYMYFPEQILDEVRKIEIARMNGSERDREYERPVDMSTKNIATLQREAFEQAKEAREMENRGALGYKEVERYVVSVARYYHDDGTIKKEEIFRDGELLTEKKYDRNGRLIFARNYDEEKK